ncbi:hypothetical protein HFD88_000035 [Aspergillus terreus]|nr:hypothetical protein HFD88_000035 [Aspergillus terreus]
MPAKDGVWNVYHLVDGEEVVAWFMVHSDLNPQMEIDRILRTSGSPYEPDFGSKVNTTQTAAEGVFIINRRCWSREWSREWSLADGEFARFAREYGDVEERRVLGTGVWVMDHAAAKPTLIWYLKQQRPRPEWFTHGAYLDIPSGEYEFCRFGFDETRTAACSFLFFTTNTVFSSTRFAGLTGTIRIDESADERVERKVREGFNFSGIQSIRILSLQITDALPERRQEPPPPLPDKCYGPYNPAEHVLRAQDIDALRLSVTNETFYKPEELGLFDLINELFLSVLERTFLQNQLVLPSAETIFPRQGEPGQLDDFCSRHLSQPHTGGTFRFDVASANMRIRQFMEARNSSLTLSEEYVASICGAMTSLITEVVYRSSLQASMAFRTIILPCDVRLSVFYYLRDRLGFSKVFWEGRDRDLPLAERSEAEVTEEEYFPIRANINYED